MKKVFLFLVILFSITISITLISAGFGVDDPNLPKLSRSIGVIGGIPDGGGGVIDPGDIDHDDLNHLAWSIAGHIIDIDIDFLGNNLLDIGNLTAENITASNLSVDHIAEKTTGHNVVFDNQIDMQTKKILNVVDPTADQEVATKKYVDDNAGGGNTEASTAAGQMLFGDGGGEYDHTETSELFWDDTNKRLGIGTATTVWPLTVSNNGVASAIFINTEASRTGAGAGMVGISDDGAALGNGHRLGFFLLGGSRGDGNSYSVGMLGYADGSWSTTSAPGKLVFEIMPVGGILSSDRNKVMVLRANQRVGIGTETPLTKLHVVGNTLSDGDLNVTGIFNNPAIYCESSELNDQTFAVAGEFYRLNISNNDEGNGITMETGANNGTNISIDTSGVYHLVAQPQVKAGAGDAGDFHMWIEKFSSGTWANIADSNIELKLSSLEEDVIVLATTLRFNQGEKIRLVVSVTDNGILLHAQSPANEPVIPSIIFTMYRVGS